MRRRRRHRRGEIYVERDQSNDPNFDELRHCARAEMYTYDQLPPEVRAAFDNSKFGPMVSEVVRLVVHRGASDQVRQALAERGLTPADVGTEGVVIETIKQLEAEESRRLKREANS